MSDDLYERQKRYYHRRASEYDATAWEAGDAREVAELIEAIAALPPGRTLDVACGTGFLSQHLRGDLTLLDASEEMLALAAARVRERLLKNGERHEIYTTYFSPASLLAELGGGELLHASESFLFARVQWSD